MNSISPKTSSNSDIDISTDKNEDTPEVKNKAIKNLYGDEAKADMLTAYMNRMNSFYSSVKQALDQKKAEIN